MEKFAAMVFFLTFTVLSGQTSAQIELGLQGGMNIANLKGKVTEGEETGLELDTESRMAFGIGGLVSMSINRTFGILFKPTYLEKGAQEKQDLLELTWQANYLELPLLLKAGFGGGNVRPYLMAGPSIGFKLSSNLKVSSGGFALSVDVDDLLTSTDFSLVFGGGLLFPLKSVSLYADFCYALGLSDIFQGGVVNVSTFQVPIPDAELKTRGIQIMGGLAFPLHSR